MKLFRQKRDKSIQKNKVSKYLLYALGEIVLIVTGVFIAVQLNNLNEQKNDDKRTERLLNNMKTELVLNMRNANYFTPFFKLQDSISAQIVNNKLSVQDFKDNPEILNNVFLNAVFPFNDNSFIALKEHLDEVPEELSTAFSYLRHLYITLYDIKKDGTKHITDFIRKRDEHLMRTKDWAHQLYTDDEPEAYYEYLANDKFFKNEVAEAWKLNQALDFRNIEIINRVSILAYEEITNALLKKQGIDSIYNYYNNDNFKKIIGDYTSPKDTLQKASIYYKDKKLYYKDNKLAEAQFMPANNQLFSAGNGHFFTFSRVNDSTQPKFRKQSGIDIIEFVRNE